jgi:lipopolysaccharide export system permease protein
LPWGNHNFRVTLYELARTKASVGLKAHIFNNTFPGLVIYIDEIADGHNTFNGVMISDSRDVHQQQTIFARRGRLISDEKALRVILRLYDGAIHPKFLGDPLKYQIVDFPTLDILLSLQRGDPDALMTIPQTDREMTIAELYEKYITLARKDQLARDEEAGRDTETDDYTTPKLKGLAKIRYALARFGLDGFSFPGPLSSPYLVELHKRFSIPLACLVFGLIGTPLGIQSRRAGRSGGYAISVVLLLIYYLFITAGESLGDDGRLPVLWAVWTPNLLLGIVGLFLLIRVARR